MQAMDDKGHVTFANQGDLQYGSIFPCPPPMGKETDLPNSLWMGYVSSWEGMCID